MYGNQTVYTTQPTQSASATQQETSNAVDCCASFYSSDSSKTVYMPLCYKKATPTQQRPNERSSFRPSTTGCVAIVFFIISVSIILAVSVYGANESIQLQTLDTRIKEICRLAVAEANPSGVLASIKQVCIDTVLPRSS